MEVALYTLEFSQTAISDAASFKRLGNSSIIRKIDALLAELETHPQTGLGKPESLRYELSGYMSRRINGEHRLIYAIDEDRHVVQVLSLKGLYSKN